MKKLLIISFLSFTVLNSKIIDSNRIDPNLKAITLASYLNVDRAKKLASKFPNYDIYIKATTTTKKQYFVVFCVNIKKSNLYKDLKKIQKILPSAYIASDSRVKQLSQDNSMVLDKPKKNKTLLVNKIDKNKKDSIRPDKKASITKFNIAYNYYKKKQYKKAIKLFNELLKIYPNSSKINFYLGRSYYEIKDYEHASAAFDRVTIIDQKNIRALLELSQTYLMLGLNDDALKGFNKVLSYNIPITVRKNIEKRVKYLENKNKNIYKSLTISVGITFDNNINSTTYVKDFIIPDYGVSTITDERYSDTYTTYMLNGLYGFDINQNTNLQNQLSLVWQKYSKDDQRLDDQESTGISKESKKELKLFSYSLMYTKYNAKNSISSGINFTTTNLAGENYMDIYGLNLIYQRKYFTSSTYYLMGKLYAKNYYDEDNKALNSKTIQITTGQTINSNSYGIINLSYDFLYEHKNEFNLNAPNKYKSTIVLANNYELDQQHTINTSYLYSKTSELTKDATFDIKKVEYFNTLSLGMTIKPLDDISISTSIKHSHNGSNIEIFSYNKTVVDCTIKKSF